MARVRWEILSSEDKDFVLAEAMNRGWADKKVQVKRYYLASNRFYYAIEPFEENCQCSNLLKYEDFALKHPI